MELYQYNYLFLEQTAKISFSQHEEKYNKMMS